jgi:hypothetical protein
MVALFDPWDALDLLEAHVRDQAFESRWRSFIRECSLLLLPGLPPEAREWVDAADEHDEGRLSAAELTAVRVRAWQFHDDRRSTSPLTESSGLRAVMYRLWPEIDVVYWYESAKCFLDFCGEAGLSSERWWPLLREQFAEIFEGDTEC